MTQGSASPCPSVKGLHDASDLYRALEMVEAYDCWESSGCAASHSGAFDRYALLSYCHSACGEPKFTNSFQAVDKALKMCFSVMCDQWSHRIKSLRWPDGNSEVPMPVGCLSSLAPTSVHPKIRRSQPIGPVTFDPTVIICPDDSAQREVQVHVDQIHSWPGKTWKLTKPTKSHALPYPCKVSGICQLLDSLYSVTHQKNKLPSLISIQVSQEPLSTTAVLIRDAMPFSSDVCSKGDIPFSLRPALQDLTNILPLACQQVDTPSEELQEGDWTSLMQRIGPSPHVYKQSPFPEDGDHVLEGVAQGHADPVPPDNPEISDAADSDGYSASVATESSHVAPPSSTGGRQEAILYHLADPPLRVFLDWADYDTMIREIAYHFGRDHAEVLDAYEVQPYPSDTPEGATPIIVHLFDDVAVGQPAKLALLDVELHGHSFEVNYAIGPTTTRTVVRLPERCVRQAVLLAANVDLYCRQEADTCFVWHGHTRWADDDHQIRLIPHGAYFRVAVPPTSRFICSTVDAVALSQQGLSDQEILDHMTGDEVGLDLSPSLLSSEDVRNLARVDSPWDDEDVFQALQEHITPVAVPLATQKQATVTRLCPLPPQFNARSEVANPADAVGLPPGPNEGSFYQFQPDAPVTTGGTEFGEADDFHLDTIATQWLAAAQTWGESVPSARFITWRVSPATGRRFCLDSREVVLYGDMENWRRQILQAWADENDARVPADIISVNPHPSNLEPGIAGHVIVQQHPLATHAASLVSIIDPAVNHGALHRQVHVIDDRSRPEDVLFFAGYHMDCPRIAICQVSLRDVQLPANRPVLIHDGDAFEVRIFRTFLPANWIPPVIPRLVPDDAVGLLQMSVEVHDPVFVDDSDLGDIHPGGTPGEIAPMKCSFTDEFVQAIRRLRDAQDQDGPPTIAAADADILPPALQELWELHHTSLVQDGEEDAPHLRVETWFLDHVNFGRCYYSRVVSLTPDTSTWLDTLLRHWNDRREEGGRLEISLVYPPSEDQAQGSVAQLILTQFPQDALRSVLLSVYDTGRSEVTPRTFALVHGASISLRSALEEVRLTDDCPPQVRHNECALWFGSTIIPEHRQAFVRNGNAFRLCIRRGQLIHLQDLLALPDDMLRRQLQDAIHGEIFRRPSGPRFPGDAMVANPLPEVPRASATSSHPRAQPSSNRAVPWIDTLNQLFVQHSATELLEEGLVLYIQTWYVHGDLQLWCTEPRAVRLTSDFTQWRPAINQVWHDRIQGSLPAEYWVIQPNPPFSPCQGQTVHVILSQFLQSEQAAVLLTATQANTQDIACQHAAYVLPRRSIGEDLARFAVPPWFRSSVMTVSLDGTIHAFGDVVQLYSGANIVVRYAEFDRPRPSDSSDHTMFLQLNRQLAKTKRASSHEPQLSAGPILLSHAIQDSEDDIQHIPLSLGQFLHSGTQQWTVCLWEMPHGNADTVLLGSDVVIGPDTAQQFRARHDFLRPVSTLTPVRFTRRRWHIKDKQVWIGSFHAPAADRAVIWCVRYQADGAVYGARTFASNVDTTQLRQSLSIQHGTKIRCNGRVLSSTVTFQHGDVLEFHAAPYHATFDLCRSSPRVQLCLEASIPAPSCSFDEDRNATLLLQHPGLAGKLCLADAWSFALIPEGLDIHKDTYEALHCQPAPEYAKHDTIELYVDGATSSHSSAWAVVAVALSPAGRTFLGCVTGLTQICPAHAQWIGATQHGNIDAELSAMTVATAFAIFASQEYSVCVRPDLALSRHIACSSATTRQPSVLAQTLHSLGQLSNERVVTQEVRAHCNDPWNELADRLAKWTVTHSTPVGQVPWQPLHELACSGTDRAWHWLLTAPAAFQTTLPMLHEGAVWQPPPSDHVIPTTT